MLGYRPLPKQIIAHTCPADQVFFAGAAGPGKTDWLMADGHWTVQRHDKAGHRVTGVLFRRTFPELLENIGRAQVAIPKEEAHFQVSTSRLVYPNGSTLRFSHMHEEKDRLKHRTYEYIWIGFDEETSFTKKMREFMQTRARTTIPDAKPRICGASNPGDIGHMDVLTYYIEPGDEEVGELVAYYPILESEAVWRIAGEKFGLASTRQIYEAIAWYEEEIARRGIGWRSYDPGTVGKVKPYDVWRPRDTPLMRRQNAERIADGLAELSMPTRCFIPARLHDNPFLALDPHYEAQLASQEDPESQAYLTGDWHKFEGRSFKEFRPTIKVLEDGTGEEVEAPYHVVPDFIPPPTWPKWGGLDPGYEKPLSFHWLAMQHIGAVPIYYVYRELYETELTDPQAVQLILALTGTEHLIRSNCDPQTHGRRSTDTGKSFGQNWSDLGLPLTPANSDRVFGKRMIHELLAYNEEIGGPRLRICASCTNLIRTLQTLTPPKPSKGRPEDVDSDLEDHAYDSLRYAVVGAPVLLGGVTHEPPSAQPLHRTGIFPRAPLGSAGGRRFRVAPMPNGTFRRKL